MLPFPPTTVGDLRESGAAASRLDELRARPRRPGEASFFYFDASFRSEAVKVLPGEYFVHDGDIPITITLGSCIAACLWDRQQRIGGMNHFMLPVGSAADLHAGRYGACAMELLVGERVRRGATRSTMEAKVFGGGALVSGLNSISIGQRNTSFVLEYRRAEGIAVVCKDVLGIHPRQVCFLPASGKRMVRCLVAALLPGPTCRDPRRPAAANRRPAAARSDPPVGGNRR